MEPEKKSSGFNPDSPGATGRWIFLVVYLAVVVSVLRLLLSFAGALIAAAVTASVLQPLYMHFIERRPRYKIAAALAAIFAFFVTICVPLVLTFLIFFSRLPQAINRGRVWFLAQFGQVGAEGIITHILEKIGVPVETVAARLTAMLQGALNDTVHWLSVNAAALLSAGGGALLSLAVFLAALFLFLLHGPRIKRSVMDISPLDDELEKKLGEIFVAYSRALVFGSFFTASLQGLVAWIAYYFLGVPESFLLGVATTFCSFIPAVGSALIWLPVALFLFTNASPIAAVLMILIGVVLIGGIDSLIKPLFYRSSYQVHPFLILLAMLGGLFWMGFWGLLLGPVLTAFMLTLHSFSVEHNLLGERGLPLE